MKCTLTFLGVFFCAILFSQKHDNVWLFGYSALDNPQDSMWGTSILDFNESPPQISYDGYKKIDFDLNCISFSDSDGNFLFSSNGYHFENKYNSQIEGMNLEFRIGSTASSQASLVLPIDSSNSQYAFFHTTWDGFGNFTAGKELYMSVLDMDENNGRGRGIELNRLILRDTLDYHKVTATKHGNGKDWWMLLRKADSNKYFKILYDGKNVEVDSQLVGTKTYRGLGQACFSPDGSWYANFSAIDENIGQYVDIYKFNRCSGELHDHIQIHHQNTWGGVSFSPNSKLLYVSSNDRVFQYDLESNNILDSETIVAEYDGYKDIIILSGGQMATTSTKFFLTQIAPDNKIYINTPSSSYVLHVIEFPNKKGIDCQINQHALHLPTVNTSLPLFPNYRLGELQGSVCDSLTSTEFDHLSLDKISIYPNPSFGSLNIEFEEPIKYETKLLIYDLTGKLLRNINLPLGELTFHLDVFDMPSGLYFYAIKNHDENLKTGKLVLADR